MSDTVFKIPLYLPSQAAAETEATITKWNVAEGDAFKKGQILAEIESAKAAFDFDAPCDGKVIKLIATEGDTVSFEEPVMEIETSDVSMKEAIPSAQAAKGPGKSMPLPSFGPAAAAGNGVHASILGIGGYLPDRVVPNKELLRDFPAVTEDYIYGVTGIRERRWARDGEKPSEMAYHASVEAIRRSGLVGKDIGAIVLATTTPDVVMPSTACILQDLLGLHGIPSFDINAACSGWLYALSVAKGLVATGVADNILVAGVEMQSQLLDKTDMGTYFLFGDGAGAAVVSGARQGHVIKQAVLRADAKGLQLAKRAVPGYKIPLGLENLNPWLRLDGHAMFRFATGGFASIIQEVTARSGWKLEEVNKVVPHQANGRILKAAAQKCGIPFERFHVNIGRVGNTSSASIPLALLDLEKDLSRGDKLVLCSVGAGVTIAALSVEW
ncbi:MAG TPA: beta-ketoacyl-ACP synthase 3 [Chitinivibrionales bacterium]|nr:beta-ketoacyl-ACP synthase 3 [Chitinivibrionales bacterium]